MTVDINDIATDSRSEMVCPHCWTEGLEKAESYASQAPDAKKAKIKFATACPNEDCPYHDAGRSDPSRVPPDDIKEQYSSSSGSFLSLDILKTNPRGVATVAAVVLIVAALAAFAPAMLGGGDGGGGTAAADPYNNVSEDDDGLDPVDTDGNWTIYETDDGYIITGVVDGETIYLDGAGEASDSPVTFGNLEDAREAIDLWNIQKENGTTEIGYPTQPENILEDSPWDVYKINDSHYVIAADYNGTTVYLTEDLEVSDDPYFYDSSDEAYNIGFDWENQYGDSETDSQLDPTTSDEVQDDLQNDDSLNTDSGSSDDGSSSDSDSSDSDSTDNSDSENIDGEDLGGPDENTVQGSVEDNSGEPVEGATVHLYSKHYTTTTNENGTYAFTGVPNGEHELHIEPPEGTELAATRNVSFAIQDGELTIQNSTDTVDYFTYDGSVRQNRLAFVTQPELPIEATGEGSSVGARFEIGNVRNADNYTVQLTPTYTAGTANREISSENNTKVINIDGNSDPETQNIAVRGGTTLEAVTESGVGSTVIDIIGNQPTEYQNIVIKGRERQENRSVSGTGDINITNNGNVDGTLSFTLEGQEDTNQRSFSGTGSQTVSNNGNVDATAEVQISGNSRTENQAVSGKISGSGQLTITVEGNQPAENVKVELTGQESRERIKSIDLYSGEGGISEYETRTLDTKRDSVSLEKNETYNLDYNLTERENNVYGTSDFWPPHAYLTRSDMDYGDAWKWSNDRGNITLTPDSDLRIKAFIIGEVEGQPYIDYESGYWRGYLTLNVSQLKTPGETTVSVDDSEMGSKNLETAGETKTLSLGTLEPGTHKISLSPTESADVNYEVSWDEQYATDDLEIDADGDGQSEYTRSQPLGDSQTDTAELPLEPGQNTIEVSNSGPTPSLSGSFTEVTASEDVQADLNGDGQLEVNEDVLRSGETVSGSLTVAPDGLKRTVSFSGPSPAWEGSLTEKYATEDPSLTVGGKSVGLQYDGVLTSEEELQVKIDTLEPGQVTLESGEARGPAPKYTLGYVARAAPESATVTVNGNTYRYPTTFSGSGALTSRTTWTEIDSLTTGENTVSVTSDPVDGMETETFVAVEFSDNSLKTTKPTLYVAGPDGEVHTKNVSDEYISDGSLDENVTLQIPQSWLGNGENTIVVQTPDGSAVGAEVRGDGLSSQILSFRATSQLELQTPLREEIENKYATTN